MPDGLQKTCEHCLLSSLGSYLRMLANSPGHPRAEGSLHAACCTVLTACGTQAAAPNVSWQTRARTTSPEVSNPWLDDGHHLGEALRCRRSVFNKQIGCNPVIATCGLNGSPQNRAFTIPPDRQHKPKVLMERKIHWVALLEHIQPFFDCCVRSRNACREEQVLGDNLLNSSWQWHLPQSQWQLFRGLLRRLCILTGSSARSNVANHGNQMGAQKSLTLQNLMRATGAS